MKIAKCVTGRNSDLIAEPSDEELIHDLVLNIFSHEFEVARRSRIRRRIDEDPFAEYDRLMQPE